MEAAALIRIAVALIFLLAAVGKIARMHGFVEAVRSYELVPPPLVPFAAGGILLAELGTALGLIVGWHTSILLGAAAALLTGFAAVVQWSLRKDEVAECGCLGSVVQLRLDSFAVGANLLLGAASIAAATQSAYAAPLSMNDAPADATGVLWSSGLLLAVTYWLIAYARSVTRVVDELGRESEPA